jgi:hypothetical protein
MSEMVPANYVGHKTANPSGSEKPKTTANIKGFAQLRIFFFLAEQLDF